MRWILGVLALALGMLAFFFGLRFGYLTLTPTWLYNAQGLNTYAYRTSDAGERVLLTGACWARGGNATLRMYSPGGRYVGGQECSRGTWSVALQGSGEVGIYRLEVSLEHFTGRLEIDENR